MKFRNSATPQGYAVRLVLMVAGLWGSSWVYATYSWTAGVIAAVLAAIGVAFVGAWIDRSVRRRMNE